MYVGRRVYDEFMMLTVLKALPKALFIRFNKCLLIECALHSL